MKTGIVVFAFGSPANILSNQQLALLAIKKAWELRAPLFTQSDISINENIELEYIKEKSDCPPSTFKIARGAVQWAKHKKLDELWVIAAAPHLKRCLRDLKEAVRESKQSLEISSCEEVLSEYTKESWFCADSTQKHTQSKKDWERREKILNALPFPVYKLIVS